MRNILQAYLDPKIISIILQVACYSAKVLTGGISTSLQIER